MRLKFHALAACILALMGITAPAPVARASVLAEFDGIRADHLAISGFELSSRQTLEISATTFAYRSGGTRMALSNAWIIDAKTRGAVWELAREREDWKQKRITTETYSLDLDPGRYEVYYSTYVHRRSRNWHIGGDWYSGIFRNGIHSVYDEVMDEERLNNVDDIYRKFAFSIEGDGRAFGQRDVLAAHEASTKDAVVAITRVENHALVRKGFEVKRPMRLHVYMLGEASDGGDYDYGRIINADTRETVWAFDESKSYSAGGAEKNRLIDADFEVPAGRYVAIYATDDSHAWDRWNKEPPHDPMNWGMTIRVSDAKDASQVAAFDYQSANLKNVVVDLTKVGDSAVLKKGFTLTRPMELRVVALGEGRGGEMFDYGWIVDANSRERVWEMEFRNTENAGGDDKNRRFEGTIDLKKGNYIAYYVSDDSHSFEEWNAAPPIDRDMWGLTIVGGDKFNANAVKDYDDDRDHNYLAKIVEVGDDAYLKADFSLDKSTEINIHALGEGLDGHMYDYGWIEDRETGKVVWEMTYRKTEHAGGHRKNRMSNDTVTLNPGKYRVYYETDGSHSFRSWNQQRPHDPEAWGITISAVK